MDDPVIDVQNACRICLGLRNLMISLECALNDEEADSPCIKDVLTEVFSSKVKVFGVYPGNICYACFEVLKSCYQLKQQFLDTENILKTLLDKNENFVNEDSAVEVIFGKNKYNLKDLIIVETDNKDSRNYKGFLKNLGKTISASFVKKGCNQGTKKIPEQEPEVMIQKKTKRLAGNVKGININEDVIEDFCTVQSATLDTNHINITDLPDVDQDIIKTAMNAHLKCNMCGKLYSKKWRLLRHLEVCGKLLKINDETVSSIYSPCPYCTRLFKNKKLMNKHINSHHKTVYTCDICNITFHKRNRYIYHKNTKHANNFYICQYCGKKYATKSSLNMHTLRHTHRNKAQCICPVCGKTFHYTGGLFYHLKMHANERKYSCEYCDRKFYTTTGQQRHIRTHTGERPYACKFCEKKFFSSGEMRKHEYLHTGDRPYHCEYCQKGFTGSSNLHRHLIQHAGSFKCDICDKGLISLDVLKIHCAVIHKINSN